MYYPRKQSDLGLIKSGKNRSKREIPSTNQYLKQKESKKNTKKVRWLWQRVRVPEKADEDDIFILPENVDFT